MTFSVQPGDGPVILAMPHGGTDMPEALAARLNANGRALADTDWHIARLYEGLLPGATTVQATFHRYVIDANRDPKGQSLYPGQNTTELCPTTDFDGLSIWQDGQQPGADEIAQRTRDFHAPYHAALAEQVERVKARHGLAILYDCHSIRSEIPFLFNGLLPVFSIGTNSGTTCSQVVVEATLKPCQSESHVLNGRFKGGWTTRHYGRPQENIHAIQMELAQRAYLRAEAAPWTYDTQRAAPLRQTLSQILHGLAALTEGIRHE
ncbi:N-formylglutamate deformylase [Neogemmobacter tilapiae]|uniref:N-formylglutamate deformylase n=1 Tax=Neogemmobacter tilapiae TaxID=875041 RepID=A0A918WH06_9RHOB|nr:N-formylglutamate deformylase [Gemmobacter tilapiae]GHC50689.1 N-formylglutamate deformylase [Gemmobacter tilapiae]